LHTSSGYSKEDLTRHLESYKARMEQHLRRFLVYLNEYDLVQAAEKAWGIVSALANIYSIVFYGEQVRSNNRKRKMLTEFLSKIAEHDLEVKELVTKWTKGHVETLVKSFADLHGFFGGTDIDDEDVKRYLMHAKSILPILYQYAYILYEYYLEQTATPT